MPFRLGLPELLIVLVILILLFGRGRLGKIIKELGASIRNLKKGIKGDKLVEGEQLNQPEIK
jgi:sec-independent protein translocase protein TatA